MTRPYTRAGGWTEDLIKREETAGAIEIVDDRARRCGKGRADYTLRVKVGNNPQPVAVALIEAKAEDKPRRAAVWKGQIQPCYYQKALHRLRPINADEVDTEFIMHRLWMGAMQGEFTDSQSKTTIAHLPAIRLNNLWIALPSFHEQKRIASILNQQMTEVERARAAAEAQLESIRALPATYLRAVFSGTKVVGGGQRERLGEILHLRKEVIHLRDNPKGSAVFVGLEHIESITGRRLGSVKLELSELTGRKPQFHKGDIVYGYLRPYLNKVWVADFDGLCSVDQYVYSVDNDRANTNFIAWFMRSPIYLERAPIDATPGQLPRIRIEEVATVEIELPSVNEQRRIASEITERMSAVHNLRQSIQDQLNSIGKLPAALLREAFNGNF